VADLQRFSIVATGGGQNVNLRVFTITGQIVESNRGEKVLADFSVGKALQWPAVLTTLTTAQQEEVVQCVIGLILEQRFGKL
jgi:hypothetical protein